MMTTKQIPAAISAFSVVVTLIIPLATLAIAYSATGISTTDFKAFGTEPPPISLKLDLPFVFYAGVWLSVLAMQVFVTVKLRPRWWLSSLQLCAAVTGAFFFFILRTLVYYLPVIKLLNDFS